MGMMDIEEVARQIVDAAIRVHRELGPGLLESAYQTCLCYELRKRGLQVECEVVLPIFYDSVQIDTGYRADMLVENCIIVENKTVGEIAPIHQAQIITYLKLSGMHVGFLLNWNVPLMKDGIKRIVNQLPNRVDDNRPVFKS
jgi:GxxExxY protein